MAEQHQQEDPKKKHTPGVAAKTWKTFNRPNAAAAATWLNQPPAQQAGEAFVGCGPNGTVDAYAFF
jgi:hypothetical protein